jgi:hypothetical protein
MIPLFRLSLSLLLYSYYYMLVIYIFICIIYLCLIYLCLVILFYIYIYIHYIYLNIYLSIYLSYNIYLSYLSDILTFYTPIAFILYPCIFLNHWILFNPCLVLMVFTPLILF